MRRTIDKDALAYVLALRLERRFLRLQRRLAKAWVEDELPINAFCAKYEDADQCLLDAESSGIWDSYRNVRDEMVREFESLLPP